MKLNRAQRRRYAQCLKQRGKHSFKIHVIEPSEKTEGKRVVYGRCEFCNCPMGKDDKGTVYEK